MSAYELRIPEELIRFFIQEIRESNWFFEANNARLDGLKSMARAAAKLYFVWLFEAVRESRSMLNLPQEFDYLKFKELRNEVVHRSRDWESEHVLTLMDKHVDALHQILERSSVGYSPKSVRE